MVFIHCATARVLSLYDITPFIHAFPLFSRTVRLLTYRLIIVIGKESRRERIQRSSTEYRLRYSFTIVPPYNPICREIDFVKSEQGGMAGWLERAESPERHSIAVSEG